jgi:hypothetical protein
VLSLVNAAIVEAPHLRTLFVGLPLAELVAEGEDALLGPRALLVAAAAAAGLNAFSARRSSTIESLPPLKRSTGRSKTAATSRIT